MTIKRFSLFITLFLAEKNEKFGETH